MKNAFTIYGRDSCSYTVDAREFLKSKNIKCNYVNDANIVESAKKGIVQRLFQ